MTTELGSRRCLAGELESFARAVLTAMGADPEVGMEVARHLVRANLSGHDSHGVLRLPRYVRNMDAGSLVPAARPDLVHERGPVAVFDVRRSFGHYATAKALEWAMNRARTGGLAAAALREPTHIGRLGEYTERAAESGLVGLVTVGSAGEGVGNVLPHGGAGPALSTNPWSIGVPAAGGGGVVFDAATTVVAEGKVQVAKDAGKQLAAGCVVAADGTPSRDPGDFYSGGSLLPLGGEVAGHKGYGLALMSALLGGLAMSADPAPAAPASGALVLVMDPAWFGAGDAYASLVADTVKAVKRTPPAQGVGEVLVAGEPEQRNRELRGREGVELPQGTWEGLTEVAERFQVPLPPSI
ncbi:MAG: Ldh family oxidoreductase [Acidimicrobiaceae bacterium]|nr:Ldh family oxidoreductase [Acidimicrobiaceae bacterium]